MVDLKTVGLIALLCTLVGCAGSDPNRGRYQLAHDRLPDRVQDTSQVADAIPRYEPYSLGGNKDYQLRGRAYRIIKDAEGFSQTGLASWYGEKFHGHTTSNGETYDMYAMSAAHKRLPLPSFVKVTHLQNGRQVVVRVNDRGPFHPGRIIDLSYAAAKKLGIVASGTGQVKIEVITVTPPWQARPASLLTATTQPPTITDSTMPPVQSRHAALAAPRIDSTVAISAIAPKPELPAAVEQGQRSQLYIQVVATSDGEQAKLLHQRLTSLFEIAGRTLTDNQIYKVQLGPFEQVEAAEKLLELLRQGEFANAFKVYPPPPAQP